MVIPFLQYDAPAARDGLIGIITGRIVGLAYPLPLTAFPKRGKIKDTMK